MKTVGEESVFNSGIGETQVGRQTVANDQAALVCPKCGATKVAKSSLKGVDSLVMWFLAKSPYRCLHCYHRFWKFEGMTASRWLVWLVLMMLVIGALYLVNPFNGRIKPNDVASNSTQNSQANTLINVDSASAHSQQVEPQLVQDQPIPRRALASPELDVQQTGGVPSTEPRTQHADDLNSIQSSLSSAAKDDQLRIARLQAEAAASASEQKQAELQSELVADQAERESLEKAEISYRIDQWRNAWEIGEINRYLDFYSTRFVPSDGVSRENWAAQRQQRVSPNRKIKVVLSNFVVSFSDDRTHGIVLFDQFYQANQYSDVTRKELVFTKEQQEWKIVSESAIDN